MSFSKLLNFHNLLLCFGSPWDTLTLSWRMCISNRNYSIDLLCKSMNWFLYAGDLHHKTVNFASVKSFNFSQTVGSMLKGESQSECFMKTKHAKLSKKTRTFCTPWYVHGSSSIPPENIRKPEVFRGYRSGTVYTSGCKKCSFFGKFGVLCFLETRVLRFALLPYYRQNIYFLKKFHHSYLTGL